LYEQVTDFGLQELRNSGDCVSEEDLPISYNVNKKLWRAPELLRDEKLNIKGTQKGDVYAFGEQLTKLENDYFCEEGQILEMAGDEFSMQTINNI
jgi:hypothetical protein